MSRSAKYYLGRIVRLGTLSKEDLLAAIINPPVIRRGRYLYTFTDVADVRDAIGTPFVFARLTKYLPEDTVSVVDPVAHKRGGSDIKYPVVAAAPFVYLPKFSGIAYQHIWNHLPTDQFERSFEGIVAEAYGGFFASANIEPVADMRTFVQRLSGLSTIFGIEAKVKPPNPLFGPVWKQLREYIAQRRLDEFTVKEESHGPGGIRSNLSQLAAIGLAGATEAPTRSDSSTPSALDRVGDAAVLMAADGYGRATVEGRHGDDLVKVKTKDNQIAFTWDKEPDPASLAAEAAKLLQRINDERYLRRE